VILVNDDDDYLRIAFHLRDLHDSEDGRYPSMRYYLGLIQGWIDNDSRIPVENIIMDIQESGYWRPRGTP
jgi:hypothetical protein